MSPDEERLVLELHSRWGNRWSRIARRLPGRTDNEIKNYWRTHMRKRAQERKRSALSPLASPSSSSSSSSCEPLPAAASHGKPELHGGGEGCSSTPEAPRDDGCGEVVKGYPMEQIWNEIESKEMSAPACYREYCKDEAPCNISCAPMNSPPSWDYSWDSLWKMDDEEYKMFLPLGDFYPANQQHASES